MINDINKLKKAMVLTKELQHCVSIIDHTLSQLDVYKKFSPVKDSIDMLKESKQLLEIHIKTQKLIIENRGAID